VSVSKSPAKKNRRHKVTANAPSKLRKRTSAPLIAKMIEPPNTTEVVSATSLFEIGDSVRSTVNGFEEIEPFKAAGNFSTVSSPEASVHNILKNSTESRVSLQTEPANLEKIAYTNQEFVLSESNGKSSSNLKSPISQGHGVQNVSVLAVENLRKAYRKRPVVNEVSLEIKQGEIVGLLGPNGAGKTTIFYMIVGLERPDEGKIYLGEKDISRLPMYLRARHGISYLPQEASVFRKLTVEENIWLVLQTLPLTKKEREHRLETLLNDFDIARVRHTKAYQLSGGERRRTEIARCLVIEPQFILLDEPFAGIDPIAVIDIQKILKKLRERGIGVLITDHNVRETLAITDRAYIINEGKIFRTGTPEALTRDEEVKQVYLGENFRM
jgi:lipopolysaccharide export system ATP-binding protein